MFAQKLSAPYPPYRPTISLPVLRTPCPHHLQEAVFLPTRAVYRPCPPEDHQTKTCNSMIKSTCTAEGGEPDNSYNFRLFCLGLAGYRQELSHNSLIFAGIS